MGNLGHIIKLNGENAFRVTDYKYRKAIGVLYPYRFSIT